MKKKAIVSGILIYTLISFVLLKENNLEPISTKYDAIIVLGNSPNYDNNPNKFLQMRLDSGIEFLKKGYSDKIILTGTKKESPLSEAEIMKRYCVSNGISSNKIILEDFAKSTRENLIFSDSIMNELNLRKALIITSNHHTKRTIKYCDVLDLKKFEVVNCKNNLVTLFSYIPLILWETYKIKKADI